MTQLEILHSLSNNYIFVIFIGIISFLIIVERFLNLKLLLSFLLVLVFIYFLNIYHTTQNQHQDKELQRIYKYFNRDKYPFIFKNKLIYDIFIKLSFLYQFNSISFNDSAFYMNKFLEIIDDSKNILFSKQYNFNITYVIHNCIDYSRESLNILKSITVSSPTYIGVLTPEKHVNNIKIVQDPNVEIIDQYVNELETVVSQIREELILKLNLINKKYIDNQSSFLEDENDSQKNPVSSINYLSNFNLY